MNISLMKANWVIKHIPPLYCTAFSYITTHVFTKFTLWKLLECQNLTAKYFFDKTKQNKNNDFWVLTQNWWILGKHIFKFDNFLPSWDPEHVTFFFKKYNLYELLGILSQQVLHIKHSFWQSNSNLGKKAIFIFSYLPH